MYLMDSIIYPLNNLMNRVSEPNMITSGYMYVGQYKCPESTTECFPKN